MVVVATSPHIAVCRFCERRRPLIHSHIVPRFIFRDHKRRFRTPELVRRVGRDLFRVQDGDHQRLLCRECDGDLLGSLESKFAARFFRPVWANAAPIRYGPWLARFCAASSWRVLTEFRESGGPVEFRKAGLLQAAEEARAAWRSFLRNEQPTVSPFDFHVRLLNPGPSVGEALFAGAISHRAWVDRETKGGYVISKLGPVVVIGVVSDPEPQLWQGTHVSYEGGQFGERVTFHIPAGFKAFFDDLQADVDAAGTLSKADMGRLKSARPVKRPRGPDFFVHQHYLGAFERPKAWALELAPIDDTWTRFYVAVPTIWCASERPTLRIAKRGAGPWESPDVVPVTTEMGEWTVLESPEAVTLQMSAYLVGPSLPDFLTFGDKGRLDFNLRCGNEEQLQRLANPPPPPKFAG